MQKKHKRAGQILLAFILIFSTALTGCGKGSASNTSATGETSNAGNDKLTRAEYIGMLADSFGYDNYISDADLFSDVPETNAYYAEIQATGEREIIERSDRFEPDKKTTLQFALESAVRAIGTDAIEASGATIDTDKLAEFYVNNIAAIDLSNLDASVDTAAAGQIISYAKDYENNLVFPQVTQIEYADGVKIATSGIMLNADGSTGEFYANDGYSVGDIIYIDATDTSLARSIKIKEVDGNSFTFEEASIDETYENLSIHGSFEGKVVDVISASDGSTVGLAEDIYDEMKSYNMVSTDEYEVVNVANTAKVDKGSDHVVFTANFDVQKSANPESSIKTNASANGEMVVGISNIRADVNYEHRKLRVLSPTRVEVSLHFDTEISSEIHGSVSTSIPLGQADIQLYGPLNLRVKFTAHIGADGNIAISYTTENVMTVGWKDGCGLQNKFDSQAKADFEADATLTAEATALMDVRLGFKSVSCSLVNAQFTSGAVAVGKTETDLLGDQPTCVDLRLYVPLRWGGNQEGCLLTDISGKLKAKGTIWDSSNSPVNMHMHIEDWKRTPGDICTRKEEIKQELTTPEGEPLEEIDVFDFEMLEFDFIELNSYTMYLGKGQEMSIGFESIPEGYSEADLKYEVMNSDICSVSGGMVHGINAGSTMIKISTVDGTFTVSLAVTVNDDYKVDGFQAL